MMNWEETVEVKREKNQVDTGKHATMNNNGRGEGVWGWGVSNL